MGGTRNIPLGCVLLDLAIHRSKKIKKRLRPEGRLYQVVERVFRVPQQPSPDRVGSAPRTSPPYHHHLCQLLRSCDGYLPSSAQIWIDAHLPACCGGGGPYNFNLAVMCGAPGDRVCSDPSKHVCWDGMHFTDAAYKIIARGLLQGSYATAPITQICLKLERDVSQLQRAV